MTTLSGDLEQNDGADFTKNTDNSYHVVFSSGLDSTALLDGFTVTAGNAYIEPFNGDGGGIFNYSSSPTFNHCILSGNTVWFGGGAHNAGGKPTFINCSILGNKAVRGRGIYNTYFDSPKWVNCTISGNSASEGCGGIESYDEVSPIITNCILWGNTGVTSQDIQTFYALGGVVTYSIVKGGISGTGNLNKDPLFVNAVAGDLRLQVCSPAIDAGSDADNHTITDLDGNSRKVDAIAGNNQIDIGAYEFQDDLDADDDGYAYCNNEDCNDNDANINPGTVWVLDEDKDKYYIGNPVTQCTSPGTGYVIKTTEQARDCDDDDANINPDTRWVLDKDNDGYYTGSSITQCTSPGAGYVINTTLQAGDCNDDDAGVNPGVVEVCGNGIDDNCNSKTDETGCALMQKCNGFENY